MIRNAILLNARRGFVLTKLILEPPILRRSLILHYELTYSVKSIRRLFHIRKLGCYFWTCKNFSFDFETKKNNFYEVVVAVAVVVVGVAVDAVVSAVVDGIMGWFEQ